MKKEEATGRNIVVESWHKNVNLSKGRPRARYRSPRGKTGIFTQGKAQRKCQVFQRLSQVMVERKCMVKYVLDALDALQCQRSGSIWEVWSRISQHHNKTPHRRCDSLEVIRGEQWVISRP